MPRVLFQPSRTQIDVPEETSLLEAASEAGLTEVQCCGITPACGKCRTIILEGEEHLSPPDALERSKLSGRRFLPGERFGCMAHVHGDVEVELSR